MKVAHEVSANRHDEIVKASEVVEVRPAKTATLSLAARRALNLLIQNAAGDAWQSTRHVISKKELRSGHKGNERIGDILHELMTTLVICRYTSPRGKPSTLRATLIATTSEEDDKTGYVYYKFSDPVRWMFQKSRTYAVLDARAIRSFESKYSMALYEIGCQMVGRRNPVVRYSIPELREVLNVPKNKLSRWVDLRRNALEKARNEIEALADFQMTIEEEKKGRQTTAVKIGFWEKDEYGKDEAAYMQRLPREQRRAFINAKNKSERPRLTTQRDIDDVLSESGDDIPW